MSDEEQRKAALRHIRELAARIRGNKEAVRSKLEIGLQNAKDEQERSSIRGWISRLDALDQEPL